MFFSLFVLIIGESLSYQHIKLLANYILVNFKAPGTLSRAVAELEDPIILLRSKLPNLNHIIKELGIVLQGGSERMRQNKIVPETAQVLYLLKPTQKKEYHLFTTFSFILLIVHCTVQPKEKGTILQFSCTIYCYWNCSTIFDFFLLVFSNCGVCQRITHCSTLFPFFCTVFELAFVNKMPQLLFQVIVVRVTHWWLIEQYCNSLVFLFQPVEKTLHVDAKQGWALKFTLSFYIL